MTGPQAIEVRAGRRQQPSETGIVMAFVGDEGVEKVSQGRPGQRFSEKARQRDDDQPPFHPCELFGQLQGIVLVVAKLLFIRQLFECRNSRQRQHRFRGPGFFVIGPAFPVERRHRQPRWPQARHFPLDLLQQLMVQRPSCHVRSPSDPIRLQYTRAAAVLLGRPADGAARPCRGRWHGLVPSTASTRARCGYPIIPWTSKHFW